MSVLEIPREWPRESDNLAVLTRWLADNGNTAKTVADAVASPEGFVVEYVIARAIVMHEALTGHQCLNTGNEYEWYCDPGDGTTVCYWKVHVSEWKTQLTVFDSDGATMIVRMPNPVN
jgi:hypothetical protein